MSDGKLFQLEQNEERICDNYVYRLDLFVNVPISFSISITSYFSHWNMNVSLFLILLRPNNRQCFFLLSRIEIDYNNVSYN